MTTTKITEKLSPIHDKNRIRSLDTLRGVALLGILLMNIVGMGLPRAYSNPSVYGGSEGPDLAVWGIMTLLFEGTMRGLFSLMFGAGIVLMTQRAEARDGSVRVADIYFRRNLWLFLFGIIHGWLLLWAGEILYFYGIAALFMFAFRHLRPRILILIGVLMLGSMIPKYIYKHVTTQRAWDEAQFAQQVQTRLAEGESLSERQLKALEDWQKIEEEELPSKAKLKEQIEGMHGHYFQIIATISETLIWFESIALYEFFFFDTAGMMLIGMAFLKLGILTGDRSSRFYFNMMFIGFGLGVAVNAYEISLLLNSKFSILAFKQAELTYDVGRVLVTLGHVGLWMLICKKRFIPRITNCLAAVGKMALTNYIMHSVFAMILFTGIGFSLFGSLRRHELYHLVLGIWVIQLVLSPIWLKYFRFGPLEWAWRSLTYWEKQPMRR